MISHMLLQVLTSMPGTVVITLICSVLTFMFTRKKYMTDVTAQQIENCIKQLNFYITLQEDSKSQVNTYMKLSESTRIEVLRLRRVLASIVNDVCTAKGCSARKYLGDKTIQELLNNTNIQSKEQVQTCLTTIKNCELKQDLDYDNDISEKGKKA